jgi:hypothetical protein
MNTQLITPLQQKALWVSDRHHYSFKPVSDLDYRRGWVGEQVSQAPVIASDRIKTLEAAEMKVCEIYVFHEAPKVLPAPKTEPVRQTQKNDFKTTSSIPDLTPIFGVLILMFQMIFQVILLDPCCVVRLEDGSLIEVVSWVQ